MQYAVFFVIADSTLENIIQFQTLSASELAVFQACLEWSTKECRRRSIPVNPENQRIVLGSVLYHIRFPTMSMTEFAQEVSKTTVLTAEDRCAVFEYIACHGDEVNDRGGSSSNSGVAAIDVDVLPQLRFPTARRRYPLPHVLSRFTTFCKSGIYSGDSSMMRMRCDQAVIIRGFGVSGSVSCDPLCEVTVTIKQERQCISNQPLSVTDDMTGWSSVPYVISLFNQSISCAHGGFIKQDFHVIPDACPKHHTVLWNVKC